MTARDEDLHQVRRARDKLRGVYSKDDPPLPLAGLKFPVNAKPSESPGTTALETNLPGVQRQLLHLQSPMGTASP